VKLKPNSYTISAAGPLQHDSFVAGMFGTTGGVQAHTGRAPAGKGAQWLAPLDYEPMLNWGGIILAGMLNGSFAVPLKTARAWKFEHIWMVFSLLAMGVIPWAGVLLAVREVGGILAAVPATGWLSLVALGLLWGVASLLYGVAVDLLGIALGFAIQLGLSIVLGALLPMVWSRSLSLRTAQDAFFLGGLALMVVGVVLCAQAGGAKSSAPGATGARFRKGLIIALLGGIGAPLLNFGIQYGISLLRMAGQIPAEARFSVNTYVAWAVFLSAASVTQSGYCAFRIIQSKIGPAFRAAGSGRDAGLVGGMSLVWAASVCFYGMSVVGLGALGPSFGWPVFIALIILTSNAWGVILGEWKGAPRAAFRRMLAGSAVLVLAAFLIGQGSPGGK
jgi:L-rhamnose-H+ transport protein